MAFVLTTFRIEEALKQPGCPICRLGVDAASRTVDAFLWENVNDPVVRKPINDAYGFCPEHTRLLVAVEMASSGPVLGVNIIYEQLGRLVGQELRQLSFRNRAISTVQTWWAQMTGRKVSLVRNRYLSAKNQCPVCLQQSQANINALTALFEELEEGNQLLWEQYQVSDGICLAHLRLGLDQLSARFPKSAGRITEDTSRRLLQQSADMQEYIRKNNWAYRDEPITSEESLAWRKTLTFFTGKPGQKFTFKVEEF